ncbi:MAG: type II toxin-antitoxin system VapC family toxin [Magnetococcales bacterium]|nr:type II toxin-antitoxin system VapC family toxin [Magnetococcales bacterium]
MSFLLDTNVCIRYLSGRSPSVLHRLRSMRPEVVRVCSVVKSEMFYGAMKSQDPMGNLHRQEVFFSPFRSLPFDDAAARIFGRIRAELVRQGVPIGPYDLQIAAIALANSCTLVTHNTAEFSRVSGLLLEDWEE